MYKEGEHYVFNEDGMYCEVILEKDLSDDEWEKYRLKVVKPLGNPGGIVKMKDAEPGEVFEVCHRKGAGYAAYGNWYIREMGSTPYG